MATTAKGRTAATSRRTKSASTAKKRTVKNGDGSARKSRVAAKPSAARTTGETVIFNAPILASTRSGLTKLKNILNKSSQGKVIDALVKDALKRAREQTRH